MLNFSPSLQAETATIRRPLWELGLGLLALRMPHYRGADQGRTYLWPIPYFIYRGEVIQAQNSGISGNFIETNSVTVNLSINAALRVNSGLNHARSGMPSLDPSFEVGPALAWDFWKAADKKNFLSLNVPVRAVVAAEFFRIDPIGYFSVPYVAFTSLPQDLTLGLFSEFTLAVMFGSKRYHDYYYGVAPEYVRDDREVYYASPGYSGSHATWYLSKKYKRFHAYGFIRYDYLKGAAFEKSPLVKDLNYVAFGGGLVWYFFQSSEISKRKRQD